MPPTIKCLCGRSIAFESLDRRENRTPCPRQAAHHKIHRHKIHHRTDPSAGLYCPFPNRLPHLVDC